MNCASCTINGNDRPATHVIIANGRGYFTCCSHFSSYWHPVVATLWCLNGACLPLTAKEIKCGLSYASSSS